jgi:hypothetical protein
MPIAYLFLFKKTFGGRRRRTRCADGYMGVLRGERVQAGDDGVIGVGDLQLPAQPNRQKPKLKLCNGVDVVKWRRGGWHRHPEKSNFDGA